MKKFDFKNKQTLLYIIYIAVGLFLLTGLIIFIIKSSSELFGRLSYNLKEVYTADHSLYFGVTRGMMNGLKPYRDVYENKPPMIFLISELSYAMLGNYHLINIFCFISILIITLLPLTLLIIKSIQYKTNPLVATLFGLGVVVISVIFAMFGDLRSGEAQVELFGASASIISIFFLALINDKSKFYSPFVILSGFFFAIAVMFKEPHGVLLVFLFLLFISNKKDFFNKVLFPAAYAIITVFFILIISNSLDTYFTIYLKNMLGNHINNYGSPWERMFDFKKIILDLKAYNENLPMLIIILMVSCTLLISTKIVMASKKSDTIFELSHLLVLFILPFAASFAIGLGGQYYNHHYVFALPYYVGLIFILINESPLDRTQLFGEIENNKINIKKSLFTTFSLCFALVSSYYSISIVSTNKEYKEDTSNVNRTQYMKDFNTYVDSVCDAINVDRYLFIGFNGWHCFGYGKHIPLGPSFAQDPNLFKDRDNYFVTSFLDNLHTTDFIVYYRNNLGVIKEEVDQYIRENFNRVTPEEVKNIPVPGNININNYKFCYRNK